MNVQLEQGKSDPNESARIEIEKEFELIELQKITENAKRRCEVVHNEELRIEIWLGRSTAHSSAKWLNMEIWRKRKMEIEPRGLCLSMQ
jgi:hypothetical protein